MNQWAFVMAAYALTALTIAGTVVQAYAAMRRAEARADALKKAR